MNGKKSNTYNSGQFTDQDKWLVKLWWKLGKAPTWMRPHFTSFQIFDFVTIGVNGVTNFYCVFCGQKQTLSQPFSEHRTQCTARVKFKAQAELYPQDSMGETPGPAATHPERFANWANPSSPYTS